MKYSCLLPTTTGVGSKKNFQLVNASVEENFYNLSYLTVIQKIKLYAKVTVCLILPS